MAAQEFVGMLDFDAVESDRRMRMRHIADEGVDPLPVDVLRPPRPKDIAYGQLQKEITYRRRVEDVGIEQSGVVNHGRW